MPGPESCPPVHDQLVGVGVLSAGKDLLADQFNHQRKNSIEHAGSNSAEKSNDKPAPVGLHVLRERPIRAPALPQQFEKW